MSEREMTGGQRLTLLLVVHAVNLIVLGTCAYAVFWLGHSGWWFALAIALRMYISWGEGKE